MPHVELPELPGIAGLLARFPRTAEPLNGLAEVLLRGPSSLTPAERETIAAFVSSRNECTFCAETHGAVARHLHGGDSGPVDAAISEGERADIDPKMQALLAIAEKVRVDGRSVTTGDIAQAREAGADDQAIHDTVLVAAAFSMYNRYVDGLATMTPAHPEAYARRAKVLAERGYLQPTPTPAANPDPA